MIYVYKTIKSRNYFLKNTIGVDNYLNALKSDKLSHLLQILGL